MERIDAKELCLPDSAPAVRADLSRDRLASVRRDEQFAIGAVLIAFWRIAVAHGSGRRLGCVSGGRAKSEERNNACDTKQEPTTRGFGLNVESSSHEIFSKSIVVFAPALWPRSHT